MSDYKGHTIIQGKDRIPVIDGSPMALADMVIEACSALERFSIEVKNTNPKSRKQLGDFFGHISKQIIEELTDKGHGCEVIYKFLDTDVTGVKITEDMLRQFFYAIFPVFKEDGVTRKTMRDYTTTDMKNFSENIRNFVAAKWQIVVEPPDPNYWLKKDAK
jgi:hypothetical protein